MSNVITFLEVFLKIIQKVLSFKEGIEVRLWIQFLSQEATMKDQIKSVEESGIKEQNLCQKWKRKWQN